MPTQPSPYNFLRGLSDFWARFFESTQFVEGLMDAAQVQVGQLYLELAEATLGTSLHHMPAFQRKYWRYLSVREDLLNFVEGASRDKDRYEVLSTDRYADAALLLNRIFEPTTVFKKTLDFDVADGAIRFVKEPFSNNPGFASRSVTVTTPSDLTHPQGSSWATLGLGVKPGDTLRIRYQSGSDHEVDVAAVQGSSLVLQGVAETTRSNGLTRSVKLSVFRSPYDAVQRGTILDGRISELKLFGIFNLSGQSLTGLVDALDAQITQVLPGNTLKADAADPSWIGRKITLRDVLIPSNDGIYTISNVVGTTVTLTGAAFIGSPGPYKGFVGDSPSGSDVGSYVYLDDPDVPDNCVFVRVSAVGGNVLTLDTPNTLVLSSTLLPIRQVFVPDSLTSRPTISTLHTYVTPGTFHPLPLRAYERTVDGIVYLAGGALIEGVDYAIDYETGTVTMLSVWVPEPEFRADYEYKLLVHQESITFRGNWSSVVAYVKGDTAVYNGKSWIAAASSTNVAPGTSPSWRELPYLFRYDQAFNFQELGIWVPDAMLDVDALYTNFGYLLSFRKPSSEQYRSFLRGVAQLFMRGPSLARFVSAFNVMAFLPVVRDDGEVLKSFSSGYETLGGSPLVAVTGDATLGYAGELVDTRYGQSGVTDAGGSTFTTVDPFFMGAWDALLPYSAGDVVSVGTVRYRALGNTTVGTFIASEWLELLPLFYQNDNGGVLTVRTLDGSTDTYTISAVSPDGYTATISPTPSTATGLKWQFAHVLLRKRFNVKTADVSFSFNPEDVGTLLSFPDAKEARNRRTLRIAEVAGPHTVYVESEFPLVDEEGLRFRVSRTKENVVVTDRHEYAFPVEVPLRKDVRDPSKFGKLKFRAFESLTTAVTIDDYVSDETWWHGINIPQEVLKLEPDSLARRQVSPQLIEHIVGALDEAVVGDFGLSVGRDDEAEPGIARTGLARWLGGQWVKIMFPVDVPGPRMRDVGQYIEIPDAPFAGYYRILDLDHDGVSIKLENFPPPEARGRVAPVDFPAAVLPPIVFRRTVGFVLMDRFLKYHSFRVRINTPDLFSGEFITDALTLLREAKPSHTYVFLEPLTDFTDILRLKEVFEVAYGPWVTELIGYEDFKMKVGSEIRVGEYFAYFDRSVTAVLPSGPTTITPNPALPYVPDRKRLMFVRFTAGTSGGRPLTEGVNYTVNYLTGTITIPNLDAGSVTYNVVILALRTPSGPPSPWWNGVNSSASSIAYAETPWHIGGTDPMIREPTGILQPFGQAIVEPPLQIRVT